MTPVELNGTSKDSFRFFGLGVGKTKNQIVLFYSTQPNQPFKIAVSDKQGYNFKRISEKINHHPWWQIFKTSKEKMDFRLSYTKNNYVLTYLEKVNSHYQLKYRLTKDLISWSKSKKINSIQETGMVIPKTKKIIYGRKKVNLASFKKPSQFPETNKDIFQLKERVLGRSNLKISQIFEFKNGYLCLFYQYQDPNIWDSYSWQLLFLDKKDPAKLKWSKNMPITGQLPNPKNEKIKPLGAVKIKEKLVSYWQVNNHNVYALTQPFFKIQKTKPPTPFPYLEKLKRAPENPIIEPRPENKWESKLVFNPAAVYDGEKVHLIYRATGDDNVSRFGYAQSEDGILINKRLDYPVYQPRKDFETNKEAPLVKAREFVSGGGSGGCEDPKLTKIKDKIYMTYTAWDGAHFPRVALTSIDSDDFCSEEWNWTAPILISPPQEIHKNWTIFPGKVNGKYAMLTGIVPEIEVFYLNDFKFKEKKFLCSERPRGVQTNPETQNSWDNLLRGAGPPPLKTDDGWLVLYHAMDRNDPGRYKVGAMVLDKNDPTEILYRSNTPLLEPDMDYENEGFKAGVVYTCGAVVKNNRLFVYYGGADTVSCVAQMKLSQLLSQMKLDQEIRMKPADPVVMYN